MHPRHQRAANETLGVETSPFHEPRVHTEADTDFAPLAASQMV